MSKAFFIVMRRPAQGNQLLTQHAGRAGEKEEKPPPTRSGKFVL